MGERLLVLDLARTVALIGMVVFHLTFDLDMFGLIAPGTSASGIWPLFARLVAGSFLFLAGVSLWLAQGQGRRQGRRWRAFLRRLAMIAGAAAVVTAGTWAMMPDRFVFFGILHSIAFASLVGMAVLHLPAVALLALAAGVVAVWGQAAGPAFDGPWLQWTGLAATRPLSVDFVPPFPWLAPFLAGLALARLADGAGLWSWLARRQTAAAPLWRHLGWPGRHSLAIYLIHQPVLFALLTAWVRLA